MAAGAAPRGDLPSLKSRPFSSRPIDADFEPSDARGSNPKMARRARRSRSVSPIELMLASLAAAGLGALAAIAVVSSGDGSATGTLAQELDALKRSAAELSTRTEAMAQDLRAAEGRLEADAAKLDLREAGEAALRTDLAALNTQVSALVGAEGAALHPGASPLAALIARIQTLEATLLEISEFPKNSKEMQISLNALAEKAAKLEAANTQLAATLQRRDAAMTALETDLARTDADLDALHAVTRASPERAPALAALASRKLEALSALETAAQADRPFLNAHRALAILLPADPDVLALAETAKLGAPTMDELRRAYAAAALQADAIAFAQADDGWNWLRSAVSGVVELHEPQTEADAERQRILSNGRRAIEAGDCRGALAAVDALPGAPGAAFKRWRLTALRRAELDERLEVLDARLLAPPPLASQT